MPLSLAKIANNTASVTFTYDGESVTIVYYPNRVTEKTLAHLQAFANMDESTMASGFAALNVTLAGLPSLPGTGLIQSWNFFEDVEETIMFPLDVERLSELPLAFRSQVVIAIMGDIRPEAIAPQMNGAH